MIADVCCTAPRSRQSACSTRRESTAWLAGRHMARGRRRPTRGAKPAPAWVYQRDHPRRRALDGHQATTRTTDRRPGNRCRRYTRLCVARRPVQHIRSSRPHRRPATSSPRRKAGFRLIRRGDCTSRSPYHRLRRLRYLQLTACRMGTRSEARARLPSAPNLCRPRRRMSRHTRTSTHHRQRESFRLCTPTDLGRL